MSRWRWLGAVVIAIALGGGVLWVLWPQPRTPITAEATAGPYLVRLKGDPPAVGVSPLTIEILGSAGETPAPDVVRFEPTLPAMGLATTPVQAIAEGTDDYRADVNLSMPGKWDIAVHIGAGSNNYDAVLEVVPRRK